MLSQLLDRRLKNQLLAYLGTLTGAENSEDGTKVAENHLRAFFKFSIACVKDSLLTQKQLLELFEDLYQCCPE